jgi:hypothetical protein
MLIFIVSTLPLLVVPLAGGRLRVWRFAHRPVAGARRSGRPNRPDRSSTADPDVVEAVHLATYLIIVFVLRNRHSTALGGSDRWSLQLRAISANGEYYPRRSGRSSSGHAAASGFSNLHRLRTSSDLLATFATLSWLPLPMSSVSVTSRSVGTGLARLMISKTPTTLTAIPHPSQVAHQHTSAV